MVKSCPKELRKTGRANEQIGAKDGEKLPKETEEEGNSQEGSQGKTNKTNF
jgi:hypothetical protein